MSAISRRKLEHLELCLDNDVEAVRTTLLEEVHLLHEALPELSVSEIDPSVKLLGRRLAAPLVICGMTGGTERAGEINRALAMTAQKHRLGFGVGSQRAMWTDPELAHTFRTRECAPDALLLANVGAVQARDAGPAAVAELVDAIAADALCVHLNVAQELVQDEGDRDFRGCLDAIATLVERLPVPIVAKETGCGLAPATLARLRRAGVAAVDVAGSGGTTWTGVEALRGSARQRRLGCQLREWGIPTAASVVYARRAGLPAIASGGVRSALDITTALALGATAAGMALPFVRAYDEGGLDRVLGHAERLIEAVRALMMLVGAQRIESLAAAPRVMGPGLQRWVQLGTDQTAAIGQGNAVVVEGEA